MNVSAEVKVSFVVPALNEAGYVDACLSSIEAQMTDVDELFVIDNGSTDGTLEIINNHTRAQVAVVSQITVAAMRNYGAKYTSGEILAFIDADCTIESGWREAVIEVLFRENVAATGTGVSIPQDAGWIPKVWWYRQPGGERPTPYLVAANFAVRRDAFEKVGGFREELVTDEDTEIGTRLTGAGYLILDSPRVKAVHHDNPASFVAFYRKEKWHATSVLQTMGAQSLDKPMAMTIAFWMTLAVAVTALIAGILFERSLWWGVLVILVVPALTACYRISQGARPYHALHLIVLYFAFYAARTSVIFRQVTRPRKDHTQGCF